MTIKTNISTQSQREHIANMIRNDLALAYGTEDYDALKANLAEWTNSDVIDQIDSQLQAGVVTFSLEHWKHMQLFHRRYYEPNGDLKKNEERRGRTF